MPVKIGSLISNLLKKSGVDTTDAKYADVLSIQTELPDEGASALEQKLIPMDTAHTNPKIRGIIQSELLDGVDAEISTSLDDFEFDDASKTELKAIKKTTDKLKAIAKKVKELEAKKAASSKDIDKTALQSKIDALNAELNTSKTTYEKQIAELKTSHQTELLDRDIEGSLVGYNYANKNLSADDNIFLANKKVKDALSEKGWKVTRDPNNPKVLIIVDKDGIPATDENHNKVIYKGFTDGILANAKMLAVSDPKDPQKGSDGNLIIDPGAAPVKVDKAYVAELDRLIES